MPEVKIGQIFGNRYKITVQIGAGGMGTVYRALDLQSQREVAVKVLNYQGALGEGEVRFRREFRAISRCDHPHVVSVLDFGAQDRTMYLVMEYIEGQDLREHLIDKMLVNGVQSFDLGKYIDIFTQVLDAVDFIHSQKIIHRDIKPENILIDTANNAKIMDFGLSRVIDVTSFITQTGEVMGTAAYISPEQGSGSTVDYRSDIYTLGVVMYEAATGTLPFSATNPIALVFQHIQDIPQSPRISNPHLPAKLEKLILKMLQKEPLDRYQRAGEIIADLKGTLEEASTTGVIRESSTRLAVLSSFVKRPDFLFDPTFVDRREELSQINEIIIDIKNGRGGTLLIEGDAGIGKTSLVTKAFHSMKRFTKKESVFLVRGQCIENETTPYKPFIECLRTLLYKSGVLSPESPLNNFEDWGYEFMKLVPEVGEIFSLKKEDAGYDEARTEPDHEKVKHLLYQSVSQYIKLISRMKPVILFIDNLQWVDAASLELFRYLIPETPKFPLLLIGAYRPYEVLQGFHDFFSKKQKLTGSFSARKILLSPLPLKEVTRMVKSMLGSQDLPAPGFVEKISKISNGNPYFIEEILHSCLEEGKIYREDGNWHIEQDSVTMLSLPSTIRELVIRRLQRLTPAQHQLLEYAAVLGSSFELKILQGLMSLPDSTVLDLVDDLVRNGLLVELDSEPEEFYAFQHILTRDILYKKIQRRKKILLHGTIADQLEAQYHDRLESKLNLLANHYLLSKNKTKALKYALLAAEKAETLFAHDTAMTFFNKALKLIEEEGEIFKDFSEQKIFRKLARILILKGEHKEALSYIKEALSLSEDLEDFREMVQLLILKGAIYYRISDYVKALEFWENALILAQKMNDEDTRAHVLDNISMVCLNLGQYDEAEEYINESLSINQIGQNLEGQAQNLHHLGIIHETRGKFDDALLCYGNSLDIMKEIENQIGVTDGYNAIGSIYTSKGHFLKAESYHAKAVSLAESLGVRNLTCRTMINWGVDLFYLADYSHALELISKGYSIACEIDEVILQIIARGNMSHVYQHLMVSGKARAMAYETLDLIKKSGNRNLEAWIYCILGTVALKQADYEEALRLADMSNEIAQSLGDKKNQLYVTILLMNINYELFNDDQAFAFAQEALQLSTETGNSFSLIVVNLCLCNLFLRKNQLSEAQKFFNEVEHVYPVVQAREYDWRILQTKARVLVCQEKPEAAIEQLIQATEIIDAIIKKISDQQMRKDYYASKERLGFYAFLIALLIEHSREEEAVRYLLAAASDDLKAMLYHEKSKTWQKDIITGIITLEKSGGTI
ncbi:protein kinase [candidate division CSSED10-310 bacterium]|uniref:Protein kinase n=1 Tax=candidate division CSSED10-310 bacterium TaxID=2855610 RepID=A0ABV6YZC2_UNCC1